MAVTVSNQPIKVYITNPSTNTAHPIGGVLTEDQQNKLTQAVDASADALLKNSEDAQTVNSQTDFTKPVKGVNSAGDALNPLADNELVTYGLMNTNLTPIREQLKTLEDIPPVENLVTINDDQSFTGKIDFSNGATSSSYEDVSTVEDNALLNKGDTEKLIENLLTEKDYGQTEVHVVDAYPEETAMENGHIYVLVDCTTVAEQS